MGTTTSSLILLRAGGPKSPLFLLPPGAGNGGGYRTLPKYLADTRAVYTFVAPDLGWPQDVLTLDELVLHYLIEIRQVQPVGPYCLAGWSFGGLLAVEIANRLVVDGQSVEHLILFDTAPPPTTLRQMSDRMRRLIVRRIVVPLVLSGALGERVLSFIGLASPQYRMWLAYREGPMSLDALLRLARFSFPRWASEDEVERMSMEQVCDFLVRRLKQIVPEDEWNAAAQFSLGRSPVGIIRGRWMSWKNARLSLRYRPKCRYKGRIVGFYSDRMAAFDNWKGLSSQRPQITRYRMTGTPWRPAHLALFDEPNVQLFGPDMRRLLADTT